VITGRLQNEQLAQGDFISGGAEHRRSQGLGNLFGSSKGLFLLKVAGDSMVDEGIMDGDYVVVKSRSTIENGRLALSCSTTRRPSRESSYRKTESP